MKKLLMIIPLVFLLCFTFGCQQGEEVAEEAGVVGLTEEDVAAIRNSIDEFVEAELAGDWDRAFGFFAEDVVYVAPDQPEIQGLSTLKDYVESLNIKLLNLELEPVDIQGCGNLAYARIKFREKFTTEEGGEPIELIGDALRILKRQSDGTWLTSVVIYNFDRP